MRGTERDNDSYPDPIPCCAPGKNGPMNNIVWGVGSLDWASLNIYSGGSIEQSLSEAEKIINKWREQLKDQWDYRDLTTGWDGYSWCNSQT